MIRVVLSPEATDQIRLHCRAHAGIETGGLLLGTRDGREAYAWEATGPGPRADCRRGTLQIDTSYMLGLMHGAQVGGIVEVLGRWHKHVAPDLRASDNDRRGANAFRLLSGADTFELVVGTEADQPIGYAAYLCTEDGLARIDCTPNPRPDGRSESGADFPSRPALTAIASMSSSIDASERGT